MSSNKTVASFDDLRNLYENGSSAKLDNSDNFDSLTPCQSTDETPESPLLHTPTIPDSVYKSLPPLLQKACSVFYDSRDKDVFFTSLITVLSGIFTNISGVYDRSRIYTNLYCFVVAPAGSGKGVMSWAKKTGMAYHRMKVEQSKNALVAYEQALEAYSIEKKQSKKGITITSMPEKPPFNLLYIPANNSSSSIIQTLSDNEGIGIICENEADTLSGALTQDWGNFSDMLRKAYHHEHITYQRKTGKEYYEIENPRLSIALSGTPGQVSKLIPTAEDGLFSRFIFYSFKVKPLWRDVSPTHGGIDLGTHFDAISEKVMSLAIFLNNENHIQFTLTDNQWKSFNRFFSLWLKEVSSFVSEDAISSVKRLGVIAFRLAMLLSLIRKISEGEVPLELECEDIDFESAITLAETYKAHAIIMFGALPKEASMEGLDGNRETLYKALPKEFKREQALEIARKINLNINTRTIDRYLVWYVEKKLLTKSVYGNYMKED